MALVLTKIQTEQNKKKTQWEQSKIFNVFECF